MELGDFHDYVKDIANVGDTLDAFLAAATRQAALQLERTHTFKYMESFEAGGGGAGAPTTLVTGASTLTLPTRTKALHFIRIALSDGTYQYLEQADPRNFETPEEATPTHFYWSGERVLRLNNTADQNYSMEYHRISYTTWPTELTEEPWLLVTGEDLMLYQTMIQLAPAARDPELNSQLVKHYRDEALRTVLVADEEARRSAENPEMLYG